MKPACRMQLLPINKLSPPSPADVYRCIGCTKPECQAGGSGWLRALGWCGVLTKLLRLQAAGAACYHGGTCRRMGQGASVAPGLAWPHAEAGAMVAPCCVCRALTDAPPPTWRGATSRTAT